MPGIIRKPMLYPAELRGQIAADHLEAPGRDCSIFSRARSPTTELPTKPTNHTKRICRDEGTGKLNHYGLPSIAPQERRMVGLVRFELTTSCTPCKRATRLRYSPMIHRNGEEAPCPHPVQVIFSEGKPKAFYRRERRELRQKAYLYSRVCLR